MALILNGILLSVIELQLQSLRLKTNPIAILFWCLPVIFFRNHPLHMTVFFCPGQFHMNSGLRSVPSGYGYQFQSQRTQQHSAQPASTARLPASSGRFPQPRSSPQPIFLLPSILQSSASFPACGESYYHEKHTTVGSTHRKALCLHR